MIPEEGDTPANVSRVLQGRECGGRGGGRACGPNVCVSPKFTRCTPIPNMAGRRGGTLGGDSVRMRSRGGALRWGLCPHGSRRRPESFLLPARKSGAAKGRPEARSRSSLTPGGLRLGLQPASRDRSARSLGSSCGIGYSSPSSPGQRPRGLSRTQASGREGKDMSRGALGIRGPSESPHPRELCGALGALWRGSPTRQTGERGQPATASGDTFEGRGRAGERSPEPVQELATPCLGLRFLAVQNSVLGC